MATKVVTVGELLDAAKKSPLDWTQNLYLKYDNSDDRMPFAGCFFGKAAYQLGVSPATIPAVLLDHGLPASPIIAYNDLQAQTFPEVLEFAEKLLRPYAKVELALYSWEYIYPPKPRTLRVRISEWLRRLV